MLTNNHQRKHYTIRVDVYISVTYNQIIIFVQIYIVCIIYYHVLVARAMVKMNTAIILPEKALQPHSRILLHLTGHRNVGYIHIICIYIIEELITLLLLLSLPVSQILHITCNLPAKKVCIHTLVDRGHYILSVFFHFLLWREPKALIYTRNNGYGYIIIGTQCAYDLQVYKLRYIVVQADSAAFIIITALNCANISTPHRILQCDHRIIFVLPIYCCMIVCHNVYFSLYAF